jgi:hypothetical protein
MDALTLTMAAIAAVAALVVLSRIVQVSLRGGGGVSFRDLRAVSNEAHERIGEHLRANFSGDPAALPGAFRTLLPVVREIAARHRVTLDDPVLRTLVVSSAVAHRAAGRAAAETAFDEALGTGRSAA